MNFKGKGRKGIEPTRQQLKLINTATAVRMDPSPEHQELVFMGRELVQITLPHSDPGNIPVWTRYNGKQVLSIRPAISGGKIIGYPYGTIPRLLLYWLTTETLRSKQKKLYLGDSLSQFMKELRLDPQRGGVRSDRARLRNQTERFFRSVFTNEYTQGSKIKGRTSWQDIQMAPQGDLWWDYQNDSEDIFDGWITLSDQAFEMFTKAPVPADMRVISALKNSSLALDLYVWATYKTFIANSKDTPQRVPWRGLMKQLGAGYGDIHNITKSDLSNFRRNAKAKFELIRIVHPTLRIDYFSGGVEIYPGELIVDRRPRSI